MFVHRFSPSPVVTPAADPSSSFSRRGFIKTCGVFALAVTLVGRASAQAKAAAGGLANVAGGDATPSLWVFIATDGTVKITCHRSEMGQQVWTSMAQIVADELEADWADVKIDQAPGHPQYGDQNTDGSRSVRYFLEKMKQVGATARRMFGT